jgi:hypothetical protein
MTGRLSSNHPVFVCVGHARRDWWGGELIVGGVLPRISLGTWGLCACLCLVLVCGGRYCLGGGSSLHPGIEFGRSRTCEGSLGGWKRGVV